MKKTTSPKPTIGFQAKFFFVKSVTSDHRTRLRLLPKQYLPSPINQIPTEVNTSLNVAADRTLRNEFPIGQIFAVRNLQESISFYQADKSFLYPVERKCHPNPELRKEVKKEYEKYLAHLRNN